MTKYNVYLGLEGITWPIIPKAGNLNWRGEVLDEAGDKFDSTFRTILMG